MPEDKQFDVAKAGASPAPPNSRPIIAAHRILPNDPMMAKSSETADEAPSVAPSETSSAVPNVVPSEELKAELASQPKPEAPPAPAEPQPAEDPLAKAEANEKTDEADPQDEAVKKLIDEKKYALKINESHGSKVIWVLVVALVILAAGSYIALKLV